MRPALDLLAQYAEYHRDRRNIASHFVGVPLIVFAVGVLLTRPVLLVGGLPLTPAWLVFAVVTLWYLTRGDLLLGLAVSAAIGVLLWLAHRFAPHGTGAWLGFGVGVFAFGWLIQFIGHWYEGRKPAFVDDIVGLLVGPMFVTAEALFALGWKRGLMAQIEKRAGPTVLRDLARIA